MLGNSITEYFTDEVYSVLADDYYLSDHIVEANKWLDTILKESKNKDLIEHTKNTKREWNKALN